MDKDTVARKVLDALGGKQNVLSNAVCMTRLRVTLANPQDVDYDILGDIQGVLGTATRGHNGLEVVFGPRVIEGIYHSFIKLTGISASVEDLFPMSRQSTNMRVQIRGAKKSSDEASKGDAGTFINDSEMSALEDIFGKRDNEDDNLTVSLGRLIVVNGPNLNMLGITPTDADEDAFPALLELCKDEANSVGFERCDCFQSNHEGDLVDMIQDTFGIFDAIVINPGAYGDSVAIRDALRAVSVPTVEVHLHKMSKTDIVGSICTSTICGLGAEGYRKAIQEVARHL